MIGRFRKRKGETVIGAVPVTTLHRQMLYDAMEYEHIPHMVSLIGLSQVSDEVDEMERRESEGRLEQITYMVPVLMAQANFMGELAVAGQLEAMRDAGMTYTQQEVEEMAELILRILHTTLVSSVSTAVGLGLLEVPEVIQNA